VRPRATPPLAFFAVGLTATLFGFETASHAEHAIHRPLDVFPSLGPPGGSLWTLVNLTGYAFNLLPFVVFPLRSHSGALWRFSVGLLLLTIASAVYVLIGVPGRTPYATGFQTASVVLASAVVFIEVRWAHRLLLAAVLALVIGSAYVIRHHTAAELVTGVLFGAIAFRVARTSTLSFLDTPAPATSLRHEVSNAWNLFVASSPARWNRMYAEGEWEFLRSVPQRPRHYVISGIVRDRFPLGADVLDVGCGHAILYPLLKGAVSSYTGLDVAPAVIADCLRNFGGSADCSFHTGSFDDFHPAKRFDVVVLNEVLYYFPLASVEQVFRQAHALLRDSDGVVVVSMGTNPKVSHIWRQLARVSTPIQAISTTTLASGSQWTIRVYECGSQV
jgi:hypothetical protein